MIQSANSHVRRLMSEKAQHEEEMELAKETFKNALLAILTQCKHLTRHTIHYLWLYSHKPFLDTVYYSYLHIALKTSCSIQLYSDKPVVREDDRGQRPDRGKYSTVSWAFYRRGPADLPNSQVGIVELYPSSRHSQTMSMYSMDWYWNYMKYNLERQWDDNKIHQRLMTV